MSMSKYHSPSEILLAEVVIAFQPTQFGKSHKGIEPGSVALFKLGNPQVQLFDCFDGACWVYWRDQPELQLMRMIEIGKGLVNECGISEAKVMRVFRNCPEFRAYHDRQK
jgi:hypothetical protein